MQTLDNASGPFEGLPSIRVALSGGPGRDSSNQSTACLKIRVCREEFLNGFDHRVGHLS